MPMLGVHQNRQSKARKDAPQLTQALAGTTMKIWIAIILLLITKPSHACMGKTLPNINELEQYSEIFIAQVTGVVLTEYQRLRKESIEDGGRFQASCRLKLKNYATFFSFSTTFRFSIDFLSGGKERNIFAIMPFLWCHKFNRTM